jgi:aryl-phospho-beta-D-glucosidase BglC (GH1 family)
MKTEAELNEAIAAAEEQIRKAKAELVELATIPEDERLADSLHSMLCTWNHTDGCGWYYEFHNKKPAWDGNEHGQYLTKARLLIGKCKEHGISTSDALSIFKLVNS